MASLTRVLVVVLALSVAGVSADGAGRAFPVESENFAIQAFQKVNPSLQWDPTNFLVDLSGFYANCKYLNQKGHMTADKYTPEGSVIDVFIDSTPGSASDIDSVHGYIKQIIDRWTNSQQYNSQLRNAKRFGCSVRPACSGNTVVACITTDDKGNGGQGDVTYRPTPDKRPENIDNTPYPNGGDNGLIPDGRDREQKALAFTPQQYDVAEQLLGKKWDRSYLLEDLSGFETNCDMITRRDWAFDKIRKAESERKMKITGVYGTAPNKGSTPDALREILSKFKPITNAKQVGCSIIPDCKTPSGMEVVIACLYEEA